MEELQQQLNNLKNEFESLKSLYYKDNFSSKQIFLKDIDIKGMLKTNNNVGFFGKTPIAKQTSTSQTPATFSANSSAIVNDTATWNGYTIGDIVAILQAYGFIS